MKNKILRKLHSDKGFSIAELLVAILILLMVSSIVATGIPVAREAYQKVILASNADVLLSTTISTLRNELGTAQDVKVDGTTITYYSPTRGAYSQIYLDDNDDDAVVMFQRYYFDPTMESEVAPSEEPLITDAAMSDGLYVKYKSIDKPDSDGDGIMKIQGLAVYRKDGTKTAAERETLSIQIASYS